MTDPTPIQPQLADVLAENGERWQISRDEGAGVWTAVKRPTPSALHIIVGHTLAELAAKLDAAAAASLGGAQAAQAATVNVPCSATALASAMSNAGAGDTLSLAARCVYRQAALPTVSHDLTITGNGATLKDSGNLTVGQGATLTTTGLNFRRTRIVMNLGTKAVITGGTFSGDTAFNGGAIENNSYGPGLFVTGATFTGNTARGVGGAIYDNGNIGAGITDCTFHGNKAGDGGAIFSSSQFGAGISDSVISGNTATYFGGGIASSAEFGLVVGGSRITGNRAGIAGGGIYNSWGPASITDTLVAGNYARGDGGGIYYDGNALLSARPVTLDGSTITRNRAGAYGGGIYDSQWQVNASDTTVTRNTAAGGGGIYATGPSAAATLTASPVLWNKPDNCEPANSITGCTR